MKNKFYKGIEDFKNVMLEHTNDNVEFYYNNKRYYIDYENDIFDFNYVQEDGNIYSKQYTDINELVNDKILNGKSIIEVFDELEY